MDPHKNLCDGFKFHRLGCKPNLAHGRQYCPFLKVNPTSCKDIGLLAWRKLFKWQICNCPHPVLISITSRLCGQEIGS